MRKESLEQAIEIIIDHIDKADINPLDKAELMINLYRFLDYKKYDENLLILSRRRN